MRRLFLILCTSVALFSCSGGDKKNTNETRTYVIGFSQCNSAEPWREAMNQEMKEEAAKYPQLELIISDAQQDNSKQVADVENFIVQEVDVLIISPNEAQPLTSVVEKAFKIGIPVIVLDRKITSDSYTVHIGADNREIGKSAGKYAAKLLKNGGKVVELWGLKGSTPAFERHEGFIAGLMDAEGIEVIYEQDAAWLRRKGRDVMENALQRFEEIDLVYAHNDPMALGAYLAAKDAGREKDIYFIGIDGLPGPEGGAQAVANGELSATFVYPTGGKEAIETVLKVLDGIQVEKHIGLATTTITPENADGYK